ncbi:MULTISPECIES: hypothetical protein [Streptomyces]|uniref:Transmembrane protein n=1 Tax=Streptomyces althioticus subsp. attaecolombicae TaxID=3075534 RepID=A0ABU3HXG3_9ACTN|nr:hypothetical protein [Streptomyces sp. DSM 41972]
MSPRELKILYLLLAVSISFCVALTAAYVKQSEGASTAERLRGAGFGFAGSMAVCLPVLMFLLS